MNAKLATNRHFYLLVIPLLLLTAFFFAKSEIYLRVDPRMSLMLSLDLLVTIPFIYFLIIRRTKIPRLSVLPVMIIGMLVGMFSLPSEDQLILQVFRTYGLPVLELGVVSFLILKVVSALRRFKLNKGLDGDFYSTLQKTCQELVPGVAARLLTTEISVIYYSLLSWKSKVLTENEYSYHRKSGSPALFGGLIFIIAAETFAMHFVFALWSEILAWVLTGISIFIPYFRCWDL